MNDLIKRDDAIREFWKSETEFRPSQIEEVLRILNSIPSAKPKVGDWIEQPPYKPYTDDDMEIFVAPKCSLCGKHGSFNDNYCPNCGAKMERSE